MYYTQCKDRDLVVEHPPGSVGVVQATVKEISSIVSVGSERMTLR